MCKVLITGSAGYVGGHLLQRMGGEGFDVVPGHPHDFIEAFQSLDRDSYDIIVHAGGIADSAYSDPDIVFWNATATKILADGFEGKFIYFSSQCVVVDNLYGKSKLYAEKELQLLAEGGRVANYTVLRPTNVYGKEPLGRKGLPTIIREGTVKSLFTSYYRDFIHVDDVCNAVEQVIENDIWGETYYLYTSERAYSAVELASYTDHKFRITRTPDYVPITLPRELTPVPDFIPKCSVVDYMRGEME